MRLRGRCKFHCTATALIFLLGAIRGIGGIVDLINNTEKLIEINTSSATLILLTIFLILLSAASFITAFNVYEQNKKSVLSGILLSAIFVINGITNGYILFGNTISDAVIINVIASLIIISLLILGRRSLNKTEKLKSTINPNNSLNPMHESLSS
jgi:hypothetical protein